MLGGVLGDAVVGVFGEGFGEDGEGGDDAVVGETAFEGAEEGGVGGWGGVEDGAGGEDDLWWMDEPFGF